VSGELAWPQDAAEWSQAIADATGSSTAALRAEFASGSLARGPIRLWLADAFAAERGFHADFVPALHRNLEGLLAWAFGDGAEPYWPGRDPAPGSGTIAWTDLTVANAEEIRDFYSAVVGWEARPHDMGPGVGFVDYDLVPRGGDTPVAGICHALGTNENIPPVWLVYLTVADVDASAARCVALGGAVLDGPRPMGSGRIAVIRDPAGAICALWHAVTDD
jgi:predicted enzyme related to lactoylglutathione lyase